MKEYDNSTRHIHISNNFILSINLLIIFDTLLLRPSLHCNAALHFTTLHPTTLHHTYRHFTSSHLHFTTLSFSFTHLHFLSFYLSNTLFFLCRNSSGEIEKLYDSNKSTNNKQQFYKFIT